MSFGHGFKVQWTEEEDDVLARLSAEGATAADIAKALPNKTYDNCRYRIAKMRGQMWILKRERDDSRESFTRPQILAMTREHLIDIWEAHGFQRRWDDGKDPDKPSFPPLGFRKTKKAPRIRPKKVKTPKLKPTKPEPQLNDKFHALPSRVQRHLVEVAEKCGCTVAAMMDRSRRELFGARSMFYYTLACSMPNASYSELGRLIDRDHATIIHGIKKYCIANPDKPFPPQSNFMSGRWPSRPDLVVNRPAPVEFLEAAE